MDGAGQCGGGVAVWQQAGLSAGRPYDVEIRITDDWRDAYPGACVRILAMDGIENPPEHPALAAHALSWLLATSDVLASHVYA